MSLQEEYQKTQLLKIKGVESSNTTCVCVETGNMNLSVDKLSIEENTSSQDLSRVPSLTFSSSHQRPHSRKRRTKRTKERKYENSSKETKEKAVAMTAAVYYGDCYVEGISSDIANEAAKETHNRYKKWWLQEPNVGGFMSSLGDAIAVPKFNPASGKVNRTFEDNQDLTKRKLCDMHEENRRQPSCKGRAAVDDSQYMDEKYYAVDDSDLKFGGDANSTATAIFNDRDKKTHFINDGCQNPSSNNGMGTRTDDKLLTFHKDYHNHEPDPFDHNVTRNPPQKYHEEETRTSQSNKNCPMLETSSMRGKNIQTQEKITQNQDRQRIDEDEQDKTLPNKCNQRRKMSRSLYSTSSHGEYDSDFTGLSSSSHDAKSNDNQGLNRSYPNHLPTEECTIERPDEYNAILTSISPIRKRTATHVENAKKSLLHALAISGGDVTSEAFLFALGQLRTLYNMTGWDARDPLGILKRESSKHMEGTWLTLSRPHFQECLGKNSTGDYMYTLGRMSFDMFYPADLVCSIQGIFNHVETVNLKDRESLKSVPRALRDELKRNTSVLRRYK